LTTTQIDIRRWNAEEFERLVLDAQPKVAVFDCDGTIWSGDSGSAFLVWSLEQGLVSRSTSDWIDTRYRAYLAGKVSEVEICGEIVQIYAGLREQELRRSAAEFVEQFVKPRIFPEINSLIATLGRAGVELWAVSSTNRWVVVEGVRPLGIPEQRVLAVEARVVDGLITSQILSVPTDKGKAEALRQVGLPSPDVVFGNSIHDLAMLEIARCAFPVNPTPALLQAAARRGWGYFRPEAAQGTEAAVGGE
jgi:phosphoserine phosphatase